MQPVAWNLERHLMPPKIRVCAGKNVVIAGEHMPEGLVTKKTEEALRVEIYETRDAMASAAAQAIADALRKKLAKQDTVRMVFAAAPSQGEMLAELVADPSIDWSRTVLFHMDEYIGLAPNATQRFSGWLDRNLFSKVTGATVHRIQPDDGADAEATRYAALLNAAPIDIVCLGIGVNGHLAFNDPPVADFDDPHDVKVVELDTVCRQQQVDDACFATLPDVPSHAVTLTIPRLLRADEMFCVVPDARKANAVRDSLRGPLSTDCPASMLRQCAHCTLFLDKDSAAYV